MRTLAVSLAIVAVVACSDGGTGPEDHVPGVGRYRYVSQYTSPIGGKIDVEATLVITIANPDSVAGHWQFSDAEFWSIRSEPISLGFFNLDAYVVYGDVIRGSGFNTFSGIAVNRIQRGASPTTLVCEGHLLRDFNDTWPGTCSLTYLGQ